MKTVRALVIWWCAVTAILGTVGLVIAAIRGDTAALWALWIPAAFGLLGWRLWQLGKQANDPHARLRLEQPDAPRPWDNR